MADSRIYVVINRVTDEKRLVEATSQAQAIRHCVATVYRADVASSKVVAHYMGEGLKIENAVETSTPTHTTNKQDSTTAQHTN